MVFRLVGGPERCGKQFLLKQCFVYLFICISEGKAGCPGCYCVWGECFCLYLVFDGGTVECMQEERNEKRATNSLSKDRKIEERR